MGGPLLPFAYDQSRKEENLPPLDLSQPKERNKNSNQFEVDLDLDSIITTNNKENTIGNDSTQNLITNIIKNDNNLNNLKSSSSLIYSSLNSSSSILINNFNSQSNNLTNTSSTVLNFQNDNSSDDSLNKINSNLLHNNNIDVPSSPLLEPQNDLIDKQIPSSSDAFDDLISLNDENFNFKNSIPSSPTLLPLSQNQFIDDKSNNNNKRNKDTDNLTEFPTKFQRPKLSKQIHPLSRHGSTFTEPTRKKQRNQFVTFNKTNKINENSTISLQPILQSKIEFAIDRDGHVYGYSLEKDELPLNYKPTLYDEPIYFVVKNQPQQEQKLRKEINLFFEKSVNLKNPVSTLNLQYFALNSLPDYITDIQNFYDCSENGIIKPLIHIDASYNNLRSINPMILNMERLEMLSLRNNKIARLSGNIDKAKDLKSLNLAMNKFKFLPHNLLSLNNLEVLAISGNPMISETTVDKFYNVDYQLLELYTKQTGCKEFLDIDKEIKCFSRIHWLKSNKQISKNAAHVSLLSRSLSTLQDLCYDDNGNLNDWNDFKLNSNKKLIWRKEKQNLVESKLPWCPKLTELALRRTSKYLISQSEVQNWKNSTSEFIYKRAMNSLIYGTNGETCGYCNENCIESVADMLEWWNFKGSKNITIKRRFCSKHCAICWMNKLNKFKFIEKIKDNVN